MRLTTSLVAVVVVATMLTIPPVATTTVEQRATLAEGPVAQQEPTSQQGSTCDYEQLYGGAIDSLVLVSRPGGQGSGFVYESFASNDTGFVLTNQHVVGAAERVTIRFRQGEYQTGTVVGTDAYADLAVVRIDDPPSYATPLSVADSVPRPGSKVAAIGNPFGLRGTITHGIVSGVNRSMPTDRGYAVPDVVQTDAPINPGNSGGPLLACDGEVVGVNTAGIEAARGENVGFAISPPMIHRVVPALLANGEVTWPYLGIRSTDVTPAIAEANGLESARGVVVVETLEGGPAEGALRPSEEVRTVDGQSIPIGGDVIVGIDGQRIDTGEELSSFLATEAVPGETVTVTVLRDGERQQVEVTLGERPDPTSS